ncbi:helix-turn-helix domain-containing protein [Loktanella sp. S4079]|uniref:helix-turn-helix domain-containing protein n=1 Tax=Loktanella sp. S4079 TaxID=579483 RepID=UPI0005FA2D54|nr:AraC family transcriptional regulator [Loktanella sp. S4079]KJZ20530.1 AraC family transcriptional regulator [Loktanella sp. S4079]
MSIIQPELEVLESSPDSLRYLEHGWPDPLCRWHSHKECELHLIVATNGRSYVGDYIGDFAPGDLFLIGPHLPHNWITDEVWTEPVAQRDMVIQFDHEKIEGLVKHFPEFEPSQNLIKRSQCGIKFNGYPMEDAKARLASLRDGTGPHRVLEFFEFLTVLAEHPDTETMSIQKIDHAKRSKQQIKICDVVDHIVQNFADEISVESAAKMAGMTEATFRRNFQATTGHRFVEFVNGVRIGQACGMLYATDEQVAAICYQVGFQNLANFNRHFLKMKGMTPSAYRDKARKDLIPTKETA